MHLYRFLVGALVGSCSVRRELQGQGRTLRLEFLYFDLLQEMVDFIGEIVETFEIRQMRGELENLRWLIL